MSANKVCLVTGASRGIGAAMATRLVSEGVHVVALSRSTPSYSTSFPSDMFTHIPLDVTDEAACLATVQSVMKSRGRIDVLVNNAGVESSAVFMRSTSDDYTKVFDTNVRGAMAMSRLVLRHSGMLKQRSGCIVNVSSVVALQGNAGQALYGASKAALVGFTRSLSKEVARFGVRVNCVSPGFIETDMTASLASKRSEIEKTIALGRFGKAEEVADGVLFLIKNTYVNG
eukprot:PhM_4_TR155/c0_g1_i2/m.61425/K00059/fabG; 3-oxoacyl-[acyl-carrier protein] reductase